MYCSSDIITFVILFALAGEFLLNSFANQLNIQNINQVVPTEFKDYYNQDQYRKSQLYLRIKTKFVQISSFFDLIILLSFWFLNGFSILDTFVKSFGYNQIITGLLYIFILGLLKFILSIPFSIYSTFYIEEKFGFNKTSPTLFIIDTIKALILSTLIGGILLSFILMFFEYTGESAWIICWTVTTFFLLIFQYLVPTWILPLFNKFTPLEKGGLRDAIINYAASINFSLDNIFIMDGSKRSTKSNAFFTGFGKHRRIVLFDTLIKEHTIDELVSVLAHEMGHFKKKHILKNLSIGILQMGIMFYLLSFFISYKELFDAFGMNSISIYAGLIFFGMLYSPIDFFLSILMHISSRKDEFEADRFAFKTVCNEEPLIKALKRLSVNNLSNLTPHPLYIFLNYSHPPVLKRIEALRSLKKDQ
ncbi:MAG: M48 family metallopeptidase [Desulfobacteraceae bacterium]|nr:M48 family metallopeptidase [Desulfobacteraceae bacterium]